MFIFKLTYKKPLEDVEKHLAAHREYLDKFYRTGNFINEIADYEITLFHATKHNSANFNAALE